VVTSLRYAYVVMTNLGAMAGVTPTHYVIVALMTVLTLVNAAMLVWIFYLVGSKILAGQRMPLITLAGLIFLLFLDWLLVEWLWDPHVAPFDVAYYGIGWKNVSSMIFMIGNYVVAGAIYLGFNAYRRRQGVDVDKVYKEIPVE
jgi:hypothetical protein